MENSFINVLLLVMLLSFGIQPLKILTKVSLYIPVSINVVEKSLKPYLKAEKDHNLYSMEPSVRNSPCVCKYGLRTTNAQNMVKVYCTLMKNMKSHVPFWPQD